MVLASASSSNGLTSSNHCSTPLARLVSPTKSNNSAPNEKKPFGIFQRPVATPARADSKKPTSSSFSFCFDSSRLNGVIGIYPPLFKSFVSWNKKFFSIPFAYKLSSWSFFFKVIVSSFYFTTRSFCWVWMFR